jgi:folate-dependent phosphoribosylglycinamide formyltransferase PurN
MKVAIITYDAPHRKTQDIIFRLLAKGYGNLHLLALPWEDRSKKCSPIFAHRPQTCIDVAISTLCKRLKIGYIKLENYNSLKDEFDKEEYDNILVGGVGVLPTIMTEQFVITNAHPGYLPNVRGLDALKWAIYEGQPIGVTTHRISNTVDAGWLIDRRIIPVFFEDTFYRLAMRVYNVEVDMLVDSVNMKVTKQTLVDDRYRVHKRMPHHLERIMIDRFDEIRRKSNSWRDVDGQF